ncbi:MAG TPA: fumarylacetoacetate hydrolase family protein, partial [Arenicellales bacterium]|nr:fumarylacetoacetate hydrolase family protein [Arenicellales bacterium]
QAEGAAPLGRKIGFTNSAIWPVYGVHAPVWGYLYDRTVARMEDGRLAYRLGVLREPKIEPEIVLHFAEAPPVDSDLGAIVECIDWVAHAFEIVQSHYPGWQFQAPDAVADSALHGALLLGEPLAVERLGADPVATLESFSVTLCRDGEELETGKGANVLGGPVAAVAHLIAELEEKQYPPLQAGEMVTTGTLTAAYPVQPGQHWSTRLEGITLEGISVELEA